MTLLVIFVLVITHVMLKTYDSLLMLAASVLYIHTSNNFATFGIYSTSGW